MNAEVDYHPAATLILMRDRPGGPPEILMLERAAGMRFAAGAMVFPGGRVDAGDFAAPHGTDLDADDAAGRIAAIRETIEETGIAIGIAPMAGEDEIARLRAALHSGASFADLLAGANARLDLAAIAPFGRWRPPPSLPHRFDTRFYLAEAPPGATGHPDGGESVHILWSSAADILEQARSGMRQLIFPTLCMLERLARLGSVAEARLDAARHHHHLVAAVIEDRADGRWLCIPEGLGYPVTAMPLDRAVRG